jgi:hypothetical protein
MALDAFFCLAHSILTKESFKGKGLLQEGDLVLFVCCGQIQQNN